LVLRDAGLVILICGAVAISVNTVRRDGIPLIARQPYQTLVPCPEPGGRVSAVSAHDPDLRSPTTLLVDARPAADYQAWHAQGAISAPFDWLAEIDELRPLVRSVARQAAGAGRQRVIVYGDGGDPDTGLEWAKLLVAEGIKHVHFVTGGAPAIRGVPPSPREKVQVAQ
jgi:rhodanese-related sulfurtransferase